QLTMRALFRPGGSQFLLPVALLLRVFSLELGGLKFLESFFKLVMKVPKAQVTHQQAVLISQI
ncbi:hypothetical protein ABPG74_007922, partial [Tetrahymena malaccensis]